jgi:hypothetical protein
MAFPFTLDVNDPKQVSSAQKLESFLGDPARRLFIFTGIAITSFASREDKPESDTVTINLRTPLARKPLDHEWSATVGLASIANTESDFIFATNAVSIDLDPITRELLLVCEIDVQGDDSVLNRFSYQLTVLVQEIQPQLASLLISDLRPVVPPLGSRDPSKPPVYDTSAYVSGGANWGGRVTLTFPAPGAGVFISLSSSHPALAPSPVSVPILGGQISADFTAPATSSGAPTTAVTITASLGPTQKTAILTVGGPA